MDQNSDPLTNDKLSRSPCTIRAVLWTKSGDYKLLWHICELHHYDPRYLEKSPWHVIIQDVRGGKIADRCECPISPITANHFLEVSTNGP